MLEPPPLSRNVGECHSDERQAQSRGAILITGGSGTLGSAIVRALCDENWPVFVNFARDEKRALQLQNETGCQLCRADVSEERAVGDLFAALPPLFAVIHAAGITRDALLLRQTPQSWQSVMNLHLNSAFFVARETLRRVEKGGRLIFLSSRVGERGAVGQSNYAAAKGAINGLMRAAAIESVGRLAVNAVCPPFVPSDLSATLSADAIAAMQSQSLNRRSGTSDSLVGAVRWLLSEAGKHVSGQVIHCDDRIL